MPWIKAAGDEVRFEGGARVRVWVTADEVANDERIVEIKNNYQAASASIKASNVKPTEKVSTLNEARKEAQTQAEAIIDEVVGDVANNKCNEISNDSESKGVNMEIELKNGTKGSIHGWSAILWDDVEPEEELELETEAV